MNPFYWYEGLPDEKGWYLTAYLVGEQYVFHVARWSGEAWTFNPMTHLEPHLFHKIKSPFEFFTELEKEATDRQRLHITATTDEDQDTINHLPFLGTN